MRVSEATFNELLALGRRQGALTTNDLRRALPVESMTPEDIAALVLRLEEADVPVEADPALGGGGGKRAAAEGAVANGPFPREAPGPATVTPFPAPGSPLRPTRSTAAARLPKALTGGFQVNVAIVVAVVLVIAVLVWFAS